jgi:hypothetical protein
MLPHLITRKKNETKTLPNLVPQCKKNSGHLVWFVLGLFSATAGVRPTTGRLPAAFCMPISRRGRRTLLQQRRRRRLYAFTCGRERTPARRGHPRHGQSADARHRLCRCKCARREERVFHRNAAQQPADGGDRGGDGEQGGGPYFIYRPPPKVTETVRSRMSGRILTTGGRGASSGPICAQCSAQFTVEAQEINSRHSAPLREKKRLQNGAWR